MRPAFYAAIGVFIGALSPSVFAEDELEIQTPPMLIQLESEGGIIHNKFKVSDHINGFALTVGMDQLIVYATSDGKHVMNGALLNEKAEDLTPGFAEKYIPEADLGNVVEKLANSSYFESHDVKSKNQLYVFHDPNCGYCKKAWETIMPYEHKKGTAVRWIPVGALGKDSVEKSAALLNADDPEKLQVDFSRGYRLSDKQIKETSSKTQDVINNSKLMSFLRLSGTPSMVYVENNKVVKIIKGFKRSEILEILGL